MQKLVYLLLNLLHCQTVGAYQNIGHCHRGPHHLSNLTNQLPLIIDRMCCDLQGMMVGREAHLPVSLEVWERGAALGQSRAILTQCEYGAVFPHF